MSEALKLSKPRTENSAKNSAKHRGNPDKTKPYRFKPGQSGNPGGRPKHDLAAEIAQAVFEGNRDAIYAAMLKAIKKGNAKVFTALADRGYGRVAQRVELEGSEESPLNYELHVHFLESARDKLMGKLAHEKPSQDASTEQEQTPTVGSE